MKVKLTLKTDADKAGDIANIAEMLENVDCDIALVEDWIRSSVSVIGHLEYLLEGLPPGSLSMREAIRRLLLSPAFFDYSKSLGFTTLDEDRLGPVGPGDQP